MRTLSLHWILVSVCLAGASFDSIAHAQAPEATVKVSEQMFSEGYQFGTAHLKAAREDYAKLQKLLPKDPRVDYAFGLILVRQAQLQEAEKLFASLSGTETQRDLKAWKAVLWCQIIRKEMKPAFEGLTAFADYLALRPSITGLSPEAREEHARWLGEVFAALDLSQEKGTTRNELPARQAAVEKALGPDLQKVMLASRDELTARLSEKADQDATQKADAGAGAKERVAERVEKTKAKAEQKEEELKQSAEEWKEWLDQKTAELDTELQVLSSQVQAIDTELVRAQQEYQTSLRQESYLVRQNPRMGTPAYAELTNITARKNDLLQSGTNLNFRRAGVVQQAHGVLERRQAVVDQYQAATGQIVKQNANVAKAKAMLTKKEAALTGKPALGAAAKPKTKAFRTYLDLDFEGERDLFLKSLGKA